MERTGITEQFNIGLLWTRSHVVYKRLIKRNETAKVVTNPQKNLLGRGRTKKYPELKKNGLLTAPVFMLY